MRAHCEAAGLLAARLGLGPGGGDRAAARLRALGRHRPSGRAGRRGGPAADPDRRPGPGRRAVVPPRRVRRRGRDGPVPARHGVRPPGGRRVLRRRRAAAAPRRRGRLAGPARHRAVPAARPGRPVRRAAGRCSPTSPTPSSRTRSGTPARSPGSADAAAAEAGLDPAARTRLRRAALVHDLGRVGVSNRVWDRPGRLTLADLEQVRLHPYLSEQVLTRSAPLRPLAALAGAHHERLDGTGYYRGVGADQLGTEQQLLAAADAYAAMRQARPHRPALTPAAACAELTARRATAGSIRGRSKACRRRRPTRRSAAGALAGRAHRPRGRRAPAGLPRRDPAGSGRPAAAVGQDRQPAPGEQLPEDRRLHPGGGRAVRRRARAARAA